VHSFLHSLIHPFIHTCCAESDSNGAHFIGYFSKVCCLSKASFAGFFVFGLSSNMLILTLYFLSCLLHLLHAHLFVSANTGKAVCEQLQSVVHCHAAMHSEEGLRAVSD
jgi:hypothetical protein